MINPVFSLELFTIVSLLLVGLCLFLTHKFVKEKYRKICYLFSALACLFVHYSDYLFDVINGTAGEIPGNLFLPEWPCNVIMWIVFALSILLFFKETMVTNYLLYISFWVGGLCSIIGIAANFNFMSNPDFGDWDIMKGLLSHVFLCYCCFYSMVEGKVKYKFFKVTLAMLIGLLLFIFCANLSVFVLERLGRDSSGTMLSPPFESMPWLNLYVICILSFVIWVGVATLFEIVKFEKGERWFDRVEDIKDELVGAK